MSRNNRAVLWVLCILRHPVDRYEQTEADSYERTKIDRLKCIDMRSYLPNPSAQAGYDTRSVF